MISWVIEPSSMSVFWPAGLAGTGKSTIIKTFHQHRRTIVLVTDALDECLAIAGLEGGSLLEILAQTLQHHPVKSCVASRQKILSPICSTHSLMLSVSARTRICQRRAHRQKCNGLAIV
jgi:hypothetical protein